MKKIQLLLLLSLVSFTLFSQENKLGKTSSSNFGPANKHFAYSHINLGFFLPPVLGEDVCVFYGKSHTFEYGISYKYKISNNFSVGLGLNYNYQTWYIKQNSSKKIPDDILYDKEKIKTNNLSADVFFRLNFGLRKNTMGNYFGIAPYGEWAFNTSRKTVKNTINSNSVVSEEYITTTNVNLNYLENLNYGIQIKIGFERIAIYGKYRLSNLFTSNFKENVSSTELPKLIIGIEIALHE